MEEKVVEVEYIKDKLISESKEYFYPKTKKSVVLRYRNVSYDIHMKWRNEGQHLGYLTFGTRRSSTVSNYGNTPIIMRRSVSSNGELAPAQKSGGSLRGIPHGFVKEETKYAAQFGSLRGLSSSKRLSKFDEAEELEGVKGGIDMKKDVDSYSDTRSHDSWDTASLNVGMGPNIKDKKGGRLGLKHSADGKDTWRERSEPATTKNLTGSINNKNVEIMKQQAIGKSTESLVSVKKKRRWWFSRKKSKDIQGDENGIKEHEADIREPDLVEKLSVNDKAISDINLKNQPFDDGNSLHDELHRSQILLKGYSQRTVAGMNLSSSRLPGISQTVTSRTSLAGSDLLISGSSKSFMQYDMPLNMNDSKREDSVTDKVRQGQTYEEQFETSLGSSNSDKIFQSSDALSENGLRDSNALEDVIRLRHLSNSSSQYGEKFIPGANSSIRFSNESIQNTSGLSASKQSMVSRSSRHEHDNRQSTGDPIHPFSLSPDSRPIRPLHSTIPDTFPVSPTAPMKYHSGKSTSSLAGQEAYPHSLMDKPVATRLTKRLSSESEIPPEFDGESVTTRKSNIAYTLTFQDEPICVNLRTKSQSLTPEPHSSSISRSDSRPCSSPHNSNYDRQMSAPNERETSPGYRLTYDKNPTRSPIVLPKKILGKKNPKVTREKDKLFMEDRTDVTTPDEDNVFLFETSHITCSKTRETNINGNGRTSITDVRGAKEIKTEYVDSMKSADEPCYEAIEQSNNTSEALEADQKPVCRLQRRNTFTLSSNGVKKDDDHGSNGDTNEVRSAVPCPDDCIMSTTPSTDDIKGDEEATTLPGKVSPKLGVHVVGSRIPVKRGRAGGDSMSRIPMLASPTATTPSTADIPHPSSVASHISTPQSNSSALITSPERRSLRKNTSGRSSIPSIRKPSLDESVLNKLSHRGPMQDNFMKVDNNAIVVKRETIIELKPEASSSVCTVM